MYIALLDPRYLVAGVGVSKHKIFGNVVVIELANDVDEHESIALLCTGNEQGQMNESEADAALRRERCRRRKARVESGVQFVNSINPSNDSDSRSATQWANIIGTCAECRESIQGGRVVEVESPRMGSRASSQSLKGKSNSLKWHSQCFVSLVFFPI